MVVQQEESVYNEVWLEKNMKDAQAHIHVDGLIENNNNVLRTTRVNRGRFFKIVLRIRSGELCIHMHHEASCKTSNAESWRAIEMRNQLL